MKKLLFVAVVLFGISFVACTPQSLNDNGTQQVDKDKVCPPGNPNC